MGKTKAIQICKNLLRTIHKIEEANPVNTIQYIRNDMFIAPTASAKELKTKLNSILKKYEINKEDVGL